MSAHNAYRYEYIKSFFEQNNCKLLSDKYIDTKSPLIFICHCGKKSKTNFETFRRSRKCKQCSRKLLANKQRRDFNYIKNLFEINNCKLISTEYKEIHDKLDYICKCGRLASRRFERFEKNPGCKICNQRFHNHIVKLKIIKTNSEYRESFCNESNKWKRKLLKIHKNCQKCNSKERLEAHHLNGWNWYENGRFMIGNGIILCQDCHLEFHAIYGRGNNTVIQYNEWNKEKQINNLILTEEANNFISLKALKSNHIP